MADNARTRTYGGAPATIATDEIGGVHHQRMKVQHGADGVAVDTSSANPLPVVQTGDLDIASLPGGAVEPDDNAANPTTHGAVVGYGLHYDGVVGAWARHPPRIKGYTAAEVIAEAARTASVNSPLLSSRGARGCIVTIYIVAKPATGSITLAVRPIGAGAYQGNVNQQYTVGSIATGARCSILMYPGIVAADIELNGVQMRPASIPLTPTFGVQVTHADSESWTYSVSVDLLP